MKIPGRGFVKFYKVKVGYTLDWQVVKWIEENAKINDVSKSFFVNYVLSEVMKKEAKDEALRSAKSDKNKNKL